MKKDDKIITYMSFSFIFLILLTCVVFFIIKSFADYNDIVEYLNYN